MADLDLSGSSNLVALVYNEQPPAVDAKVLQERLKREKQLKKDDEKAKRFREKEKEKEEKKMQKLASPHNKRVTIEHVKYTAPDETEEGVKPREERGREGREDEEGEKDKTDFRCGAGTILCLIAVFILSLGIAFLVSFKLTERSLGGRPAAITQEEDGIVRIGALFSSEAEDEDEEVTEGRLPRNIQPLWYNVTTRINLPGFVDLPPIQQRTFENTLLAAFRVLADDTRELVLNAVLLTLPKRPEEWRIMEDQMGKASPVQVSSVALNETAETVTLTFSDAFKSGAVFYLKVAYSGVMDESSKSGLYISTYRTRDGKEKELAVTQCEPHYARRILPCMDEPDRKAVFRVTIEHPKGTRAISNGIETVTEPLAGSFLRTSFKDTPLMSSYLLALSVSDLAVREKKSARGIPVRVFVQSDLIDHMDYALNASVTMLDFYEKEFDTPYPLDKLDILSVKNLAFGAMENWGLLVFHETYILYDPRTSSSLGKKDVAQVLAHEIAHQWFGNLVTMKWWEDVWLNEAFASHCEYTATARAGLVPGLDDLFYATAQHQGFSTDALSSSRPVSLPIHRPVEIAQLFDSITYDKGPSVVRMLEDVVGVENFRNGVRAYLKKFAYGNAAHDDLLKTIAETLPEDMAHIGRELKPFVRRFTKQNGYPVLNVERPDTLHVEITQEWFKRDSNSEALNKHGARYGHLWEVPLFYEMNEEEKPVTWMTNGIRLPSNQSDLLIINSDSKGFYRVNYDPRSWTKIHDQLSKNHTHISALTRFRLIEDAFALAEAGKLPYDVALDTMKYLPSEEDEMPLLAALQSLAFVREQMGDGEESHKIKAFIRRTLAPFYKQFVDWEQLEEGDNVLRSWVTAGLIKELWEAGHKEVADRLQRLFETSVLSSCKDARAIASQCSKVDPLIRMHVYCEGIKRGRDEEFDVVLRLYKNEIVHREQNRLLAALKCSRDTKNLKRLFQALLDKKSQGIFSGASIDEHVLLSYSRHELANKIYNEFFYEHHEQLFKKFTMTGAISHRLAEAVTANTKGELADVESFLLAHPEMDDFEGFAASVERGRAQLNWQRKHAAHLVNEFDKRANRV